MRDIPIDGMILEKFTLALQGILHALLRIDILLTTSDNTYETEFWWINAISENIQCVRSCVHEVQLRQDTDCVAILGVDGVSEFERFRVGEVNISRGYGQYDTVE